MSGCISQWNSIMHVSPLTCLVFTDLQLEVAVAGYLGFQLVNITSVSLTCHSHNGTQLSFHTDILYQPYIVLFPRFLSSDISMGGGQEVPLHFCLFCINQSCTNGAETLCRGEMLHGKVSSCSPSQPTGLTASMSSNVATCWWQSVAVAPPSTLTASRNNMFPRGDDLSSKWIVKRMWASRCWETGWGNTGREGESVGGLWLGSDMSSDDPPPTPSPPTHTLAHTHTFLIGFSACLGTRHRQF